MAKCTSQGLDALVLDMAELAALPDDVISDILNAEADVVVEAQKEMAKSMGVVDTGTMVASIKKGTVKSYSGEKRIYVTPYGTNYNGVKNTTVAFMNEFGKTGQPARPFILTANEKAADSAVEAGEKIYNSYLDSKNL